MINYSSQRGNYDLDFLDLAFEVAHALVLLAFLFYRLNDYLTLPCQHLIVDEFLVFSAFQHFCCFSEQVHYLY